MNSSIDAILKKSQIFTVKSALENHVSMLVETLNAFDGSNDDDEISIEEIECDITQITNYIEENLK